MIPLVTRLREAIERNRDDLTKEGTCVCPICALAKVSEEAALTLERQGEEVKKLRKVVILHSLAPVNGQWTCRHCGHRSPGGYDRAEHEIDCLVLACQDRTGKEEEQG